jgi:hypothetical protein
MSMETDLMELIQPLVGGMVIWMEQNSPRPPLPFCAMKIKSVRSVNRDHYSAPDANGSQTVSGDREFTLSIQRYQAYGAESVMTPLQTLSDKLKLASVQDKFAAKNLAAYDAQSVTDISALLDKTQIEKRANLDIMCRYKSRMTDNVGVISTASIESVPTPSEADKDSGAWTVTAVKTN